MKGRGAQAQGEDEKELSFMLYITEASVDGVRGTRSANVEMAVWRGFWRGSTSTAQVQVQVQVQAE